MKAGDKVRVWPDWLSSTEWTRIKPFDATVLNDRDDPKRAFVVVLPGGHQSVVYPEDDRVVALEPCACSGHKESP